MDPCFDQTRLGHLTLKIRNSATPKEYVRANKDGSDKGDYEATMRSLLSELAQQIEHGKSLGNHILSIVKELGLAG